jgi:HlyD family secretion protein
MQEVSMKRWLIIIFILAAAAIGTAGYLGFHSNQPQAVVTPAAPATIPVTVCDVEQTVTAPGSLVNARETILEMPVAGRLAEILVRPGDSFKAGQVLTRLADPEQFAAQVAAARLELLQAQQALAILYANAPSQAAEARVTLAEAQKALDDAQLARTRLDYPRAGQTTIEQARLHLALMEEQLSLAQKEYNRAKNRPENDPRRLAALQKLSNAQRDRYWAVATLNWYIGGPGETELAEADASLALAQIQLTQAQSRWESLKDGPAALDVALAEAKVADAQARLSAAEKILASVELTAPFDGIVLEVNARPGEMISAGAGVMLLNDPQTVEVEATVIEEDFPFVEVGQPVSLFFDALPSETITGTVSRIVPKRAAGDRPLYYLYITLDHVPAKLVAGMSADASIVLAQRKGVLCLPRAVVKASANGTAVVEVWANWQKEKRTVNVGLRGDTSVEILSGLKAGEQVVAR